MAMIRRARAMEATKERGNAAYGKGQMQEAIDAWTEVSCAFPHWVSAAMRW
jgi:hypothetical protein